jgi:hypothetical protein
MTQRSLQGRSDHELLWFQRRNFLKSAAAWTAAGGFDAALAQTRSNVVELVGDATLNGTRLWPQDTVQTGDTLTTGPGSMLIFVIGNSAFHMRQNSTLTVERGASIHLVSVLRLLTGAVVSVWGKGYSRQIIMPTLTAGIRGTGVYTEIFASQGDRNYLCNCYGTVDVQSGPDHVVSQSDYHQSFWGEVVAKDGHYLTPGKAINHTDEELEYLARLTGQRTNWQILGRKGIKNGMGYMDETTNQQHPATLMKPQP